MIKSQLFCSKLATITILLTAVIRFSQCTFQIGHSAVWTLRSGMSSSTLKFACTMWQRQWHWAMALDLGMSLYWLRFWPGLVAAMQWNCDHTILPLWLSFARRANECSGNEMNSLEPQKRSQRAAMRAVNISQTVCN